MKHDHEPDLTVQEPNAFSVDELSPESISAQLLEGYFSAALEDPRPKRPGAITLPGPSELWDEETWLERAAEAGYRIQARPNRTRTHVVCGLRDCGSRLAAIGIIMRFDAVVIEPGYAPDSRWHGTWSYAERNRKRASAGSKPRLRRYPMNDGVMPNSVMDEDVTLLPIAVRCKDCGMGNVLSSSRLGVTHVMVRLTRN